MTTTTIKFEIDSDENTILLADQGVNTKIVDNNTDSVQEASLQVTLPAVLCDEELLTEIGQIPNKMAFKIGDVADILGVKQYVLRYWETEFDLLKPKKASNNQRMYLRKDVENALLIKKLLYRDRFSIEGARNALKGLKSQVRKEKDYTQVYSKMDSVQEKAYSLAKEIHHLKSLFQ